VAREVEQVVIQGSAGAPVPGDGAAAGGGGRGTFGAGASGGALVPPRVVQVADRTISPQLRADGAGVTADEPLDRFLANTKSAADASRAVAHHVHGTQPQPGPASIQAGQGEVMDRRSGQAGAVAISVHPLRLVVHLACPTRGVEGANDLRLVEAGLAGRGRQRAQVSGGIGQLTTSAAAEPSKLVRERALPHQRELAVRACQRCVQLRLSPDVLREGSRLYHHGRIEL